MVTKKFWRQGEPYVWATSLALSLILFMTFLLFYVVLANGIAVFWPKEVTLATLSNGGYLLGEIIQDEKNPTTGKKGCNSRSATVISMVLILSGSMRRVSVISACPRMSMSWSDRSMVIFTAP